MMNDAKTYDHPVWKLIDSNIERYLFTNTGTQWCMDCNASDTESASISTVFDDDDDICSLKVLPDKNLITRQDKERKAVGRLSTEFEWRQEDCFSGNRQETMMMLYNPEDVRHCQSKILQPSPYCIHCYRFMMLWEQVCQQLNILTHDDEVLSHMFRIHLKVARIDFVKHLNLYPTFSYFSFSFVDISYK